VKILDFLYVVPFRNQSASETTVVENRGNISHFLT